MIPVKRRDCLWILIFGAIIYEQECCQDVPYDAGDIAAWDFFFDEVGLAKGRECSSDLVRNDPCCNCNKAEHGSIYVHCKVVNHKKIIRTIRLASNELQGQIPTRLTDFSDLKLLDLSGNTDLSMSNACLESNLCEEYDECEICELIFNLEKKRSIVKEGALTVSMNETESYRESVGHLYSTQLGSDGFQSEDRKSETEQPYNYATSQSSQWGWGLLTIFVLLALSGVALGLALKKENEYELALSTKVNNMGLRIYDNGVGFASKVYHFHHNVRERIARKFKMHRHYEVNTFEEMFPDGSLLYSDQDSSRFIA